MEWISVKEKQFAQITESEKGYMWESIYNKPFLAAVPTNKGWYIEKVVLVDEIGLCICSDGDTHPYGWDMTDVTHWMQIEPPKNKN